jgi:ubiquinone/menaquinone biosynthesis C-methylase UbiE
MSDETLVLDRDAAPDPDRAEGAPAIPDYLRETYAWAYLSPRSVRVLDRPLVVSSILWGNYRRLLAALLAELEPGQRVLQPACVYGDFSTRLARFLGPHGGLEVIDIAPIQVQHCRRKLADFPQARVRLGDAAALQAGTYDAISCFFLLHELPDHTKRLAVDALLAAVRPGGKAVFVDYHRPHPLHPLKPVTGLVFSLLEPFAGSLWRHEIEGFAGGSDAFTWSKETYFGGLYQKVVARRPGPTPD